jgi:hypothetical protein
MTMPTHARGASERVPDPTGNESLVGGGMAAAHLATIERFCWCAAAVLLAGNEVAGIIALKAAAYFWRIGG